MAYMVNMSLSTKETVIAVYEQSFTYYQANTTNKSITICWARLGQFKMMQNYKECCLIVYDAELQQHYKNITLTSLCHEYPGKPQFIQGKANSAVSVSFPSDIQ